MCGCVCLSVSLQGLGALWDSLFLLQHGLTAPSVLLLSYCTRRKAPSLHDLLHAPHVHFIVGLTRSPQAQCLPVVVPSVGRFRVLACPHCVCGGEKGVCVASYSGDGCCASTIVVCYLSVTLLASITPLLLNPQCARPRCRRALSIQPVHPVLISRSPPHVCTGVEPVCVISYDVALFLQGTPSTVVPFGPTEIRSQGLFGPFLGEEASP